ncbi:MAG: hypothetical protein JWO09_2711 [Bacteroidetes bacterium]|nr:hypothetical protein [Bacteroidota bacterium]
MADHLPEIRNKHITSKAIVPLVGAGTSMLLKIPGWDELVKMYHTAVNSHLNFEEECRISDNDMPKVTDRIFNETGRNFQAYWEFLRAKVRPRESGFHELPGLLVKHFDQIITTNFDSVFDAALDFLEPEVRHRDIIYPNINAIDFNNKVIVYIHGKAINDNVVFRYEEYENAYGIVAIKNLLTEVIKRKSLLFIGFSFQDKVFRENLLQIITRIRSDYERTLKVHGHADPETNVQDMYVILHKKDVITEIKVDTVTKMGITERLMEFYDVEGENLILKNSVVPQQMYLSLNDTIGSESTLKFQEYVEKTSSNKINQEYFHKAGIKVVEYDGERIEINEYIKQITRPEPIASAGDLSSASTTK